MSKNDTWFDAFFKAVTSSQEIKDITSKDWSADFREWLKNMENEIAKATEITSSFKDSFDTPEAREAWENFSSWKPYINRTSEEEKEKPKDIEIKYFENKNPDTFGFAWVAWMNQLKDDLREKDIQYDVPHPINKEASL